MGSSMTVGEIINALRGYPEHYAARIGTQEVAGVHKADTIEEGGVGPAVVLELQTTLPMPTPDKPRSRKPRD